MPMMNQYLHTMQYNDEMKINIETASYISTKYTIWHRTIALNKDANMVCSAYTITNGCGHMKTMAYRYCNGDHIDGPSENELCFTSAPENDKNRTVTVCMGTRFCNRGCKAMSLGWLCCTCGFRYVDGFYHPLLNMAVHMSPNGLCHGFCITCKDADVGRIMDPTRTMYATTHSDAVMYKSGMTNPNVTEATSLDLNRSPNNSPSSPTSSNGSQSPISYDYDQFNACSILARDLHRIAKAMQGTSDDVFPIQMPA